MKYAIWNLVFENGYGTGPESAAAEAGGRLEAAYSDGTVESGAQILGYIITDCSYEGLSQWNFSEITQEEALAFAAAINESAQLTADGKIAFSY